MGLGGLPHAFSSPSFPIACDFWPVCYVAHRPKNHPELMARKILATALTSALASTALLALNSKNAGPEKVEIKFNLPPPVPLSPEEEMKTFKLEPGFKAELVACEPMIEAPIAINFDDQGRMFVVEMRGYMRDKTGSTEDQPTGRVSLLEDTDGDGRMDKATAFLDNLVMPRSVLAVNGGALIAEPPNLYFCKDTDGDGKADTKDIVTNDYGTKGGQPEHMANTPTWAMDNSIWSAGYATRLKLRGGAWLKDVGLGRGQWGLCQDDAGRLYYNYNSDFLRADLLPADAFARHPLLREASSINSKLADDQTIWPSHPTPGVNRGYDPKSLRPDGTLSKPTATCGAAIYRGELFDKLYRGNAFIPEPSANLVKRYAMQEKDGAVKAINTSTKKNEFMTSTDERFRPVQAANGPDGALYLVDMYRGIIQHSSFLTHYLLANIEARKLEQPFNCGRIWRIVPDKANSERPQPVKIPADLDARIALLGHTNGWVRDTAQRLIVESGNSAAAAKLAAVVKDASSNQLARLHALWTLDGLMASTPDVLKIALKDADAQVRAAAVRIAPKDLAADLQSMTSDSSALVKAHVGIKLSLFNLPDADTALAKMLVDSGKNALVREGSLTGLRGRETSVARGVLALATGKNDSQIQPVVEALASLVAQSGKAQPTSDLLDAAAALKSPKLQEAILKAMVPATKGKSKDAPVKLIWLEKEPAALASLRTANTKGGGAKALAALDARLAWPGKPGAPPPPKVVPLNAAQTALMEQGRTIYHTLCAACHQPHGFGLDGLAPPLVDSEYVLGKPDVIARIVMHGLAGPVKVGGRTWNLAMPPLPQLTDEQIAGVLTYIRREWEHNASPVDTALITKVREENKGRMMMWSADELKAKPEKKTK